MSNTRINSREIAYNPLVSGTSQAFLGIISIWVALHEHAVNWPDLPIGGSNMVHHKQRIDADDLKCLKSLMAYNEKIWHSLCIVAGMTVYGAVALSWCKDARLSKSGTAGRPPVSR